MRGRWLVGWLVVAAGLTAGAGPVPVEVHGWPFEVSELKDGSKAFLNRTYTWQSVPEPISGWQITRVNGGSHSRLTVKADADGALHVAASRGVPHLEGWVLVRDWTFHYTDQNRTRLHVFRRPCRAGESVPIPQGGWTGVLVLAPRISGDGAIPDPDVSAVPGVVIAHSPAVTQAYIGCPSITILPDGAYVASHSFFGKSQHNGQTRVFRSLDRGNSWEHVAQFEQHWANLFQHNGALFIMGVGRGGAVVIRRSGDGGHTWTDPTGPDSGLLLPGPGYHCAPVPVVRHRGRLWRGMEDTANGGGWPRRFRSFVMSAPLDADLLDADSWTSTNRIARSDEWPDPEARGWLEGNAVVTPTGDVVNILRVDDYVGGTAARVHVSPDGTRAGFDPATGFFAFPGGAKKFTIRYDSASRLYWALTNPVDEASRAGRTAGTVRNTLALIASPDLRDWRIRRTIIKHPDPVNHGFQYVDWVFDGDDIVGVSRTACDDGLGGAHNHHDANFLTFHRVRDFRRAAGVDGGHDEPGD